MSPELLLKGVARALPLLRMLPRSSLGRSPPGCPVVIRAGSLKRGACQPEVAAALMIFAYLLIGRPCWCAQPSAPLVYLVLVVGGPEGRHWVISGR